MAKPAMYADDGALMGDCATLVERVRGKLGRTLAVINGKGGQGKTSLAANLAGLMAEALVASSSPGRVLAIDMDPQGNLGLDLGYQGRDGDDRGGGTVQALMGASRLEPLREVRPQLDVIPGGRRLYDVPGLMFARQMQDNSGRPRLSLAAALAEIADDYEWILIDCPPLEAVLQDLALAAACRALVPASFDEGSRQGMEGVSDRFMAVRDLNPDLELLGVAMFGLKYVAPRKQAYRQATDQPETRETGQRARIRNQLKTDLARAGTHAPVFTTVIRHLPSVAESCRKRGQLVFELESATDGPKWWEIRAGTANGHVLPTVEAAKLANEYQELAAEVFGRYQKREHEAQEAANE